MPKLSIALLLLFTCTQLFGQLSKTPLNEASFSTQLNKVVLDFPANFNSLQGNRMPAEVDADTYLSTVCFPGALVCKVMRYRSVQDKSASWQALLYEGDSFEEAVKLYRKMHALVRKTLIKGTDGFSAGFEGKFENIDENVGFAVSTLRLNTKNSRYRSLVAELNINSSYTGWEVKLDLYTRSLMEEENTNGQ